MPASTKEVRSCLTDLDKPLAHSQAAILIFSFLLSNPSTMLGRTFDSTTALLPSSVRIQIADNAVKAAYTD